MAKSSQYETYAYLDRLSTEQLEDLLRADLASPDQENEEVVFHILELMEAREKESPTGRLPNAAQAWADFRRYYTVPEGEGQSLYPGGWEDTPIREPSYHKARPLQYFKVCGVVAACMLVIFGGILAGEAFGHEPLAAMGLWSEEIEIIPSHVDLMMYMAK